ncbi:MAG TPA: DUF3187 family protein [Woeseiaceae bacterium]|nr:DUF3187 family protein [Woeseiaceae bacterium]
MRRIISIILLVCCGAPAAGDEVPVDAFPLRSHNPVLQVFGLPAFQTHELVMPGGIDFSIGYDVANDADDADRPPEFLIIDAETQVLNLAIRRRFGERFELGLDIPFVRHSGGSFDSLIYNFHDFIGLSNSMRDGPDDQFRLLFERDGLTLLDLSSPESGIGDVQLTGAMRFGSFALRGSVKAPTGDAAKLTGSGAMDVSLGIHGGGTTTLWDRDLSFSGFAGVLALGDGDVMPEFQRSAVPYGGAALRWHVTQRLALATQLYAQGPYFDIDLDELGGNTFQLAFGGDYVFPRQKLLLRVAIAEDIAAAAAPDFALHLSIRRYGR